MINSIRNTACNITGRNFFFSIKSAHYGRFLICLVFFSLLLARHADSATEPSCYLGSTDDTVIISHIIDGDTVILKDGRRIRLIGINAPEIGRHGKRSESGANAAREYLLQLVQDHKKIHVQFDVQQSDRYKRTLAHLFLPDGKNIQARLLSAGVVTPLIFPPNLKYLDCYLHQSNVAKRSQLGLWKLKQYQPLSSSIIDNNTLGYHVIHGRVERLGESRSSFWINLSGNVAIRIKRADLIYFNESELHKLKGEKIQARGWVYIKNRQFRINLRHRSDMMLIK